MLTADFHFDLPEELIAQQPTPKRDQSRLLVLHRNDGRREHRHFPEIVEFLRAGDVLVMNNSKVIPARLSAVNARSSGGFEILLLNENGTNDWWAMVRPGKRARIGTALVIRDSAGKPSNLTATVCEINDEGHRRLRFEGTVDIAKSLDEYGEVPLPPYINRSGRERSAEDRERYQTVFAETKGSVAAPTAGLHFTKELFAAIESRGVEICFVTLHVGPGTFAPVKSDTVEAHRMHFERYELSRETAETINAAKKSGRRVIAVGTTTVRVLETAAVGNGVRAGSGRTDIFIYPPREFQIVDALLTNFHLPCSTLLMLVSAFAAPSETRGRELILAAYKDAIAQRYRFFSYGDAMMIL